MCRLSYWDNLSLPRLNRWRRWGLGLMLAAAMAIALTGCGEHAAPPAASHASAHRYELHGSVISVDAAARKATIKHEKIPDLMEAMQMNFSVPDAADLERLQPGKLIDATLVVENNAMWLEGVKVKGEAPPDASATPGHDH